jgi:MFS family permease
VPVRPAARGLPFPAVTVGATRESHAGRRAPAAVPEPAPRVPGELSDRAARLVVGASVVAVGAFLAARFAAWPPHEDEVLALVVGRSSLGDLLGTVLGERGGAPLHFVAAWFVAHAGGGLLALRFVSVAFALASIPLVAALAARLAGRTTAAVATALASASWMLLFHGVYARMYSLFLFTSLLSYLALLSALRHGGRRRWALWAAAILLTVATHPYGVLVLGSQLLFLLLTRERVKEAAITVAAVLVLGIPFWITDLVLAGRFDVGVGGGGKLGDPLSIVVYLGRVGFDFSAGPVVFPVVLALAAYGLRELGRADRRAALLLTCVVAAPVLAFAVARVGASAAPETRHLIFALPFFSTAVAAGIVAIARLPRPGAARVAALTTALLVVGGAAWTYERTPLLVAGEPSEHREARRAAAAWLAATGDPADVLLGYNPVFLEAWERSPTLSRLVVPRADARLASSTLRRAGELGRGTWVLNAADTANVARRGSIELRVPRPPEDFEARAFGPYLVVRTREPVGTPAAYADRTAAVMVTGKAIGIGDADVNFATLMRAGELLAYGPPRVSSSRSTSSR